MDKYGLKASMDLHTGPRSILQITNWSQDLALRMVMTTVGGEERSVGQPETTLEKEPTLTGVAALPSPQLTLTQQQNPGHPGHGLCLTLLLDLRRPVQPLHPLWHWYPQRAAHLWALVRRAPVRTCLHARLLSKGLRRCQKILFT